MNAMMATGTNCGYDRVEPLWLFLTFWQEHLACKPSTPALSMQSKHSTTKPQSSPDFPYLFKILKHDHNSYMKMFFPNYLWGKKKQ